MAAVLVASLLRRLPYPLPSASVKQKSGVMPLHQFAYIMPYSAGLAISAGVTLMTFCRSENFIFT